MICLSPDPVCCILYSSIWLCVIISLRVILSNYVPNLSITRSHRGGCYMLTRIRILIKSRCLRIHSVSRLTLTRLTHMLAMNFIVLSDKKIILSRIEKWLNSLLDHSCKTKFFLLLKPKSNCSGLEINAERNVNTA